MAKRTPRHFDGTQITGKMIGDILPKLLKEITTKTQDPREAVFQEWFLAIGEKMAPFTQPLSLNNWVLTVKVKSSTLYSLLSQHERLPLLRRLQKKFPIVDLQFKIG
jgi:hypothetical protein